MKGFKFKFQSILEMREKRFKDAQLDFARAQNRVLQEKTFLDAFYQDLDKTKTGLENILNSGTMDYTFIFCHQNYISKLNNDIINQLKIIEKFQKIMEEKNRLMLEALKEKKIMEKLREKAQEEFKKEIERQDIINIDEIAVNRYKRTG